MSKHSELYSEHHWSLERYCALIKWIKKPRKLDFFNRPLTWYATWQDAYAVLVLRSESEVAEARDALKRAEARHKKVLVMKPKAEPGK